MVKIKILIGYNTILHTMCDSNLTHDNNKTKLLDC